MLARIMIIVLLAVATRLGIVTLRRDADVDISGLTDSTTTGPGGAVRSLQAADVSVPVSYLQELWTPRSLERLARTYWRFLSRVTLGLIRVVYTESERCVVLLVRPLKLLSFTAPEYELHADRGLVRWRIERGLLVARRGRGRGYLQIDVRRLPSDDPQRGRIHVEVEVASFHPAIAAGLGARVYDATQSRIHVLVTMAFLRSLSRRELDVSRVGRYEDEPAAPREPEGMAR